MYFELVSLKFFLLASNLFAQICLHDYASTVELMQEENNKHQIAIDLIRF